MRNPDIVSWVLPVAFKQPIADDNDNARFFCIFTPEICHIFCFSSHVVIIYNVLNVLSLCFYTTHQLSGSNYGYRKMDKVSSKTCLR